MRPQTSKYVTDAVVQGLYCPSTKNLIQKAHDSAVKSQSQLNLFTPIVRSLAILHRHIITSPDNEALATNISLACVMLFLKFSGIFSISATSCPVGWSLGGLIKLATVPKILKLSQSSKYFHIRSNKIFTTKSNCRIFTIKTARSLC